MPVLTPLDVKRYQEIAAEFRRLAELPDARLQQTGDRLKRYAEAIQGGIEAEGPAAPAAARPGDH
ncbi:MAG TPA: hypothetical protein VEH84_02385 [Alphaproteobacteria bacterium]|nr:hypothetical protein [Alphaproteobacteria bacterium]